MRYAFILRNKLVWPICVQCRVLAVSVSGYHQHQARRRKIASRRHLSDEALLVHIRAVYAVNRGAYGWQRIWRELVKCGVRVGKQRVQRLMQQHGIHARGKRKFRVITTDSKHHLPITENLLDRKFTVAAPNLAWVATAGNLVSWASLCPKNDESAGKRRSNRLKAGVPWLKTTLVQCAWAAARSKGTYLHAQYVRIRARRGNQKAICAVAASILTSVYHMLKAGTFYEDPGPDYFDKHNKDQQANKLVNRLQNLGFNVTIQPAAA